MQLLFQHWLGEGGGGGGQMRKFVFLDVHFDIEKDQRQDSKCRNNFVQGCLVIFCEKMCTKAIFFHPAPILFYIKCLTNTLQPHILMLNLFSTRMQFS